MNTSPWSLILFTLFMQMAIGAFWVTEFIGFLYSRRFGWEFFRPFRLFFRSLILSCSILALAVSFFHLGSPQNALHALNNLKFSWLSREILIILVFVLLILVLVFLEWKKVGIPLVQRLLAILGGLVGVLAVFTMARLYMLPTIPHWNHFSTPLAFYTASLLLGSQLTAVVSSILFAKIRNPAVQVIRSHWYQKMLGRIEVLSLCLIGIIILFSAVFLLPQNPSDIFIIRILLSLSGAFVLGTGLIRMKQAEYKKIQTLIFLWAGFLILFLAEFMGRYLFYAAYNRLGL